MKPLALALLLAGAPDVEILPRSGGLEIQCPAGVATRLRLPESLLAVKTSAQTRFDFGFAFESFHPAGVVVVRPRASGLEGSVEFVGPSGPIQVRLSSTDADAPSAPAETPDGGIGLPEATPAEAAPLDVPAEAAPPEPDGPADQPTAVVPPVDEAEAGSLADEPSTAARPDLLDLLGAEPIAIGRREGRPGQRPVELVDALRGEQWVVLRLVVYGGAEETVAETSVGDHLIEEPLTEVRDGDLRILIPVPTSALREGERLTLVLDSGARYRIPLSAPTFVRFLKSLFG